MNDRGTPSMTRVRFSVGDKIKVKETSQKAGIPPERKGIVSSVTRGFSPLSESLLLVIPEISQLCRIVGNCRGCRKRCGHYFWESEIEER